MIRLTFNNLVSTVALLLRNLKFELLLSKCPNVEHVILTAANDSTNIYHNSEAVLADPVVSYLWSHLDKTIILETSRRFGTPCTVNVHENPPLTQVLASESAEETTVEWPTMKMRNPLYLKYFLVVFSSTAAVGDAELDIQTLVPFSRQLNNMLLVTTIEERENVEFWRLSADRSEFVALQAQDRSNGKLLKATEERPNFHGSPLVAITCALCGNGALRGFLLTKKWASEWDAAMYELFLTVNATIQFEAIGSLPSEEPDEDGEWDQWVAPLVDGSAAISAFGPLSVSRYLAFHYTSVFYYDFIVFITALPKRVRGQHMAYQLVAPFEFRVWMAFLVAMVALIATLEMVIHVQRWFQLYRPFLGFRNYYDLQNLPRHEHYYAFSEVMRPVIGQPGFEAVFEVDTRGNWKVRLLLGLWLLVLNELRTDYQNFMMLHIVAPAYTKPPETFRELAYSHYTTYALFWGGIIEEDFKHFVTDYTEKLRPKVLELAYIDPDCFTWIQRGDYACIGLRTWFIRVGPRYSLDTRGRLIYQESKDRIFQRGGAYAISKHYPFLLDPMDFIIRQIHSGGLIQTWSANLYMWTVKRGKNFAHQMKDTIKSYNGREEEGEETISVLLLNVAVIGYCTALGLFLYERLRPSMWLFMARLRLHFSHFLWSRKCIAPQGTTRMNAVEAQAYGT